MISFGRKTGLITLPNTESRRKKLKKSALVDRSYNGRNRKGRIQFITCWGKPMQGDICFVS